MSEEKKEETSVQEVEIDLNELLGTGTDAIMIPGETKKKENNIFSPLAPDTKFLDKPEEKKPDPVDPVDPEKPKDLEKPVDPEKPVTEEEDLFKQPAGETDTADPVTETPMHSVAANLIKKGLLTPFEDDKELSEYTGEDLEELLEANFTKQKEDLMKELPAQFLEHLPFEMQKAYNYIAEGGTDLKGMFQALASSTEVQDYDVKEEGGQKSIIRTYLQATQWGTTEEIEEEIYSLEDAGTLKKKANQFKPKLDNMKQQVVDQKIKDQQTASKQREDQSQKYIDNVYTVLEKGELNGVTLDNKTQNMLYAGLTQSNFPSISGKQTNMLGHLLEKHQWVEPRHDLIAEALWLLADPEGYHKSIKANTENANNEKVLRTLKTEQANKNTPVEQHETNSGAGRKPKGISRQVKDNFFKR